MVPQRGQVPREVLGRAVPLLRIFCETPLDHPDEVGLGLGVERSDGRRIVLDDHRERLDGRRPLKGPVSRRHFVEDRPERKLVRAEVHGLPRGLLGGHVTDGPHHDTRFRAARDRRQAAFPVGSLERRGELRQAEVQDLGEAVAVDHDVLGLEIPVHDPGGVRLGQAVGDLGGDRQQPPHREGAGGQDLPERLAVNQLHDDDGGGVDAGDVVDRDDRRVVQGRGRAGFSLEPGDAIRVIGELGRKDLDRDDPIEPRVPRAVHLAHAARAERREHFVWAKLLSRGERHQKSEPILTLARARCRLRRLGVPENAERQLGRPHDDRVSVG